MEAQFDVRVKLPQQRAQTPAGEKVFVVGLEHVPRRRAMIPEIAEQLAIRHGDEELARRHAADFGKKRGGVVEVFEHFEAERGVEGGVGKRKRAAVDVPVWKAEAGEFGAIGGVDLGARPVVAIGEQAAAVGAEPAADIDNAARRRAEITAEQQGDFAAALACDGPSAQMLPWRCTAVVR